MEWMHATIVGKWRCIRHLRATCIWQLSLLLWEHYLKHALLGRCFNTLDISITRNPNHFGKPTEASFPQLRIHASEESGAGRPVCTRSTDCTFCLICKACSAVGMHRPLTSKHRPSS